MPVFKVKSPDLSKLIKNTKTWDTAVSVAVKKFLTLGTLEAEAKIREEAPVKTGELRRRIRHSIKRLQGFVFPTIKYAIWVHEGTDPHVIRPRNKKALFWKGAAHPVKSVQHPGSKANPFVERGAKRAEAKIDRLGDNLLKDLENHLTKGIGV